MTLVVDATVVVTSIASAEGFEALGEEDLVAPPLMWSEARSTLHQILGCQLVTLDGALRRGTDRLGFVVTPDEL